MYLLTNPLTTIAGIYTITMDRIAFDTGYDESLLTPMFRRFEIARKALYYSDEWIILPSWPKHQRVGVRDNNRKGIDNILAKLAEDVFLEAIDFGYDYDYIEYLGRPLQAPSKPLLTPLQGSATTLNLNLDLDTDTDTKINPKAGEPDFPAMKKKIKGEKA